MPLIAKKSIRASRAIYLLWVLLCCLGGCVHITSGQLLAMAPQMQEAADRHAAGAWPWLALTAAVLAAGLFIWRGRGREAAENPQAPGAPLDSEDMALYRTARDSLSFLLKRRLRRTKVVSLELLRRNKERL